MTAPVRVQLSRAKGSRLPANTVVVARPSVFGNPWTLAELREVHAELGERRPDGELRAIAVDSYRSWLNGGVGFFGEEDRRRVILRLLPGLQGKNLGCWCALDQPCHADVLLELAAAPESEPPVRSSPTGVPPCPR